VPVCVTVCKHFLAFVVRSSIISQNFSEPEVEGLSAQGLSHVHNRQWIFMLLCFRLNEVRMLVMQLYLSKY
jgi:hypothetical protein